MNFGLKFLQITYYTDILHPVYEYAAYTMVEKKRE